MLSRWRSVRTVIAAVLLLVAAVIAAELLYIATMPLRDSESLARKWESSDQQLLETGRERWAEHHAPLARRSITLTLTPTTTETRLMLEVPVDHPIVESITMGTVGFATREFAERFFGKLQIEDQTFAAEPLKQSPRWSIGGDPKTLKLEIISASTAHAGAHVFIERSRVAAHEDELRVHLERVTISGLSSVPSEAEANFVRFDLVQLSTATASYLSLSARPWVYEPPQTPRQNIPSRQEKLRRLGQAITMPFLSRLIFAVLGVLPMIAFLWVTRARAGDGGYLSEFRRVSMALILFHTALAFLSAVDDLRDVTLFGTNISDALEGALSPYVRVTLKPLISGAAIVLEPVIGVLAAFSFLGERSGTSSWLAPRALGVLSLLCIASVAAAGFLVVPELRVISTGLVSLETAAIAMVLLVLAIYGLSAYFVEPSQRALATWTAFLSAVAFVALDVFTANRMHTALGPLRTLLPTTIVGTFLLACITAACHRLWQLGGFNGGLWHKRGLFLLVMAFFTLPIGAIAEKWSLAGISSFGSFYYGINSFIRVAWVLGLLWLFREHGRTTLKLDAEARGWCILAVSTVLFNPAQSWMYVPISFLLGWLLLSRVFIRGSDHWAALEPLVERAFSFRPKLIDDIVDLNHAARAYREYREKQKEKLIASEIEFPQYESSLDNKRKELDDLHNRRKLEGYSPRDVALVFGPYPSAWQNAMHGAKWGLLLAAPWIVFSMRDLLQQASGGEYFPLWRLKRDLLGLLLAWTVHGFAMGYLYPYIRGRNGLEKGFVFFLATALPLVPISALFNSSGEAWTVTLFWAMQEFVHCMLLGLIAFDYAALQRGGLRDWRLLFEVHNLPAVGLSISSLVVAIGTAVTTLLSDGATGLVTAALKLILPAATGTSP